MKRFIEKKNFFQEQDFKKKDEKEDENDNEDEDEKEEDKVIERSVNSCFSDIFNTLDNTEPRCVSCYLHSLTTIAKIATYQPKPHHNDHKDGEGGASLGVRVAPDHAVVG